MAEPTLIQVFGENSTQTATDLIIKKSDLPGLTASNNNSAESLLVGLVLKALAYLNETNQETNPDIQVLLSIGGLPTFVQRGENQYRRDTITIELDKLAPNQTIDPDDY